MTITQEKAQRYLEEQKLMSYLGGATDQLRPDWPDLARLHILAMQKKAFTILEFGVGRSTIVLADALRQNKLAFERATDKPEIFGKKSFRIFSVDASEKWIENAKGMLPAELRPYVEFHRSKVQADTFNERMCHFFESIPDIVPDFIYLDGPDPSDVEGSVRGLSWKNPERTVMAADILLMEPTLLPGTFIIIDGRTNNARFLASNLQRKWEIVHYEKEDITTMELAEPPLGERNKAQLSYRFQP